MGMTRYDPLNALNKLAHLAQQRVLLEQQMADLVGVLRSPNTEGYCDASWADIGSAIGTSRQAAQQRFGWRQ